MKKMDFISGITQETSSPIKLNFIRSRNNMMVWRQIEKRQGMTFMRLKQRQIISVVGDGPLDLKDCKGGIDDERIC